MSHQRNIPGAILQRIDWRHFAEIAEHITSRYLERKREKKNLLLQISGGGKFWKIFKNKRAEMTRTVSPTMKHIKSGACPENEGARVDGERGVQKKKRKNKRHTKYF